MKIIGKPILEEFKRKHADARSQVDSWIAETEEAEWKTPHEVKDRYPNASLLGDGIVIFNIKRDNYRLKVLISYKSGNVSIQNAGTHSEYMRW